MNHTLHSDIAFVSRFETNPDTNVIIPRTTTNSHRLDFIMRKV